jgi:glycolate oxidase
LIEIDGGKQACEKDMKHIIQKVKENNAVEVQEAATDLERENLWAARRAAYGVFAKLAPDIVTEDVTVPVSRVPLMIKKINEISSKYGLKTFVMAHAGDGNMHPMIPADRTNKEEWKKVEAAFSEIFQAAAKIDGTLSGEHGIGLAKAAYLPLVMNNASIDFMKKIKRAVDPDLILNPGKFV